jgi:hypothetical protein
MRLPIRKIRKSLSSLLRINANYFFVTRPTDKSFTLYESVSSGPTVVKYYLKNCAFGQEGVGVIGGGKL